MWNFYFVHPLNLLWYLGYTIFDNVMNGMWFIIIKFYLKQPSQHPNRFLSAEWLIVLQTVGVALLSINSWCVPLAKRLMLRALPSFYCKDVFSLYRLIAVGIATYLTSNYFIWNKKLYLHKIREIRWPLIHQRPLHLSCLVLPHPLDFALTTALPSITP